MVLRLKDFFLISKPSLSYSTSVGTIAILTAFLLCLSFRFFFSSTLNSSSLSTNGRRPFSNPIDSLSSALISWFSDGSLLLAFPLDDVNASKSTLDGLQCFLTSSCLSILLKQLQVLIVRGNSPLILERLSLISKFFNSFSFEDPTSMKTFFEESSTELMECPLPKSIWTAILSRLMLVPCSIFSQDWKQA